MSTARNELDRLAGEYVLGLLSDEERTLFEDALSEDDEARRALREARERFLELDVTAPAVPAPSMLWEKIETSLDRPVKAEREAVIPFSPRRPPRGPFWRGFATAAAAASVLALIGFGALWTAFTAAKPELIVVLLDSRSQPGAIVEAFAGQRVRVVPLERFDIPEGKTLQVWTLPDKETGPVSLGLLQGSAATEFTGANLPPPRPDQLYEITLEQAGGSPTGKPTGPIVAKGFARQPQI